MFMILFFSFNIDIDGCRFILFNDDDDFLEVVSHLLDVISAYASGKGFSYEY